MDKIRIGLIGAGMISEKHLKAYTGISEAEVVAVCSRTQQSAERCANAWKIPNIYTDFHELLKRDDIDAVDICLHNNLHTPVTVAALRAGKHVYCEKPLAGSYADGKTMLDTAAACGKTLHIQLGFLYRPYARAAKRLVDGGALGELYHARTIGFRRRNRPYVDGSGSADFVHRETAGGGALYDFGVYHISLLLYLMGMPQPRRMSGQLYQKITMDERRRQESGYDVEELGVGFIRFDNEVTMDIFESWAVHLDDMNPSVLLGSKGGLKLEPFSFHTTLCDTELDCTGDLEKMHYRWMHTQPYEYAYAGSEAHWIAALLGHVPMLPTAELALNTLLIQDGVSLSSRLGREVTAEETIAASVPAAIELD